MKIVIGGDYCENYRVSHKIKEDPQYSFFDEIKHIFNRADFSVVNFEFPISCENAEPIKKYGPGLKGTTNAIIPLKEAGVNVCTMANNHILDEGLESCLYTKALLEENGFYTVGVGVNEIESSNILYLSKDNEHLAIINCCEHEFSVAEGENGGACPLDPIKQYYKIQEAKKTADYIIVITHGGHEFFQLPSLRMVETYRFFIDAGADAVINHHQHCYSGYEIYKEKPIFYGLGNLLFDWPQKRMDSWYEGFLLGLNFEKNNVVFELHPYFQCKKDVSVTLMNEYEKEKFFENIKSLNSTISDRDKLKNELDSYYLSDGLNALKVFEPYNGRIMNKFYYMGLLPKFCSGSRGLGILNYLQCESHRDKIIGLLKNKI